MLSPSPNTSIIHISYLYPIHLISYLYVCTQQSSYIVQVNLCLHVCHSDSWCVQISMRTADVAHISYYFIEDAANLHCAYMYTTLLCALLGIVVVHTNPQDIIGIDARRIVLDCSIIHFINFLWILVYVLLILIINDVIRLIIKEITSLKPHYRD